MNITRMSLVAGVWVCLASMPCLCIAQQKTDPVAEAARKAKAQEKQQAAKAPVVWTNDNLPTSGTVNVVGQAAPGPAAQANTPAADAQPADDPADPNTKDKLAADLAAAQKDLDSAKTDLDLAQREYKLDSDQFYSAPDYASNLQGQAKLNADKSQVTAKQQAVDAAQKKVDDLQKQLDALSDKSKAETAAPKS
jgi:hypothetical protein